VDTSVFYRLTNGLLGPGRSLDVLPDGSGQLWMGTSDDSSGQRWRLVDHGGGKYALQTSYLGECFSLDVVNDGTNTTPCLAPTGGFSGQNWTLTPRPDGTCRLVNDFTGPDSSLGTDAGTDDPVLGSGDHSGQHWTLTGLGQVPGTVPIPDLAARPGLNIAEGPTDFARFARPRGVVKAVMIFVDFPDAHADPASADAIGKHLLGQGQAQQLFQDQSYGQLTLDVTVRSDLGWRRLAKCSTDYHIDDDFESQKSYISDAAALFHPAEIRFPDYQIVFVVAPETASFRASPAFTPGVNDGAPCPGGTIRHAVTFGTDSYTNRFINLVHEVGHLFGLPDLYPGGGGAYNSQAGCWPIMSDIFHSVSFLGWHRHKNGWLPASRATYINAGRPAWYGTLSPLPGSCGLSMVVLPVDDVHYPSKVFVIELAQPVLGTNGQYCGEGVLVYTVDATIDTLESPVVIIPRQVSDSPDYGYLYEAPYGVGDVARARGPASVTLAVTVLQKFGSCYNIKIEYRP
jgi:M6 family metalloprotease-like protein